MHVRNYNQTAETFCTWNYLNRHSYFQFSPFEMMVEFEIETSNLYYSLLDFNGKQI